MSIRLNVFYSRIFFLIYSSTIQGIQFYWQYSVLLNTFYFIACILFYRTHSIYSIALNVLFYYNKYYTHSIKSILSHQMHCIRLNSIICKYPITNIYCMSIIEYKYKYLYIYIYIII